MKAKKILLNRWFWVILTLTIIFVKRIIASAAFAKDPIIVPTKGDEIGEDTPDCF